MSGFFKKSDEFEVCSSRETLGTGKSFAKMASKQCEEAMINAYVIPECIDLKNSTNNRWPSLFEKNLFYILRGQLLMTREEQSYLSCIVFDSCRSTIINWNGVTLRFVSYDWSEDFQK